MFLPSSNPGHGYRKRFFHAQKKWLLWSVLALPLALGVSAPAALAANQALNGGSVLGTLVAQQAQPNHYAAPVGGITLEQAADKVRRKTGGRVLSATPVEKGGRRGYNVRVLVDGKRVKQYYVDSEGRMSSR
jgi:hypothetical protein